MTNRKSFLRDCLLGLAATLVPKILQPVLPEVVEEMVEVEVSMHMFVAAYDPAKIEYTGTRLSAFKMRKGESELIAEYTNAIRRFDL